MAAPIDCHTDRERNGEVLDHTLHLVVVVVVDILHTTNSNTIATEAQCSVLCHTIYRIATKYIPTRQL